MKNIYLVRHGQTTTNIGGVSVNNSDVQLTELGEEQAQAISHWLVQHVTPIDSISMSKFIRTHQTANPLITATKIKPTVIDGLEEFNYVCYKNIQGLTGKERKILETNYWLTADIDSVDGGRDSDGESFNDFNQRMTSVINHFDQLPKGNHVVYTHGLWLGLLIWRTLSMPVETQQHMLHFRQFELALKIQNCEVFLLQLAEDKLPAITRIKQ